jgi:hypothetical protein
MAGKSKHGKNLSRSKRKGKKIFTAPAVLKPVAAGVTEPAPQTTKAPLAPKPKAKAAAMAAEASNVVAELRRIGIVAGAIIVILVILALIFA